MPGSENPTSQKGRLDALDLARGLALLAMAVYHFTWDLEFFGYAPPGMTAQGGWRLFARSIASSFLFLVGFSLVLAHARAVRWPSFLRRLAMVAGAAAAITLVTWLAMPDAFIFFGILHHIALASLVGLAFLRPPLAVLFLAAAFAIVAPIYLRAPVFDHPALWWVGLSPHPPRSNDYVPLLPFFAPVLLGIAAARIAQARGWLEPLRGRSTGRWSAPLLFAGRHSLFVYLVHQPVLVGAIWLFSLAAPPAPPGFDGTVFLDSCAAQCADAPRGEAFCTAYCGCVLAGVEEEGLEGAIWSLAPDPQAGERLQSLAAECSLAAEPLDEPGEQAR